jgi:NAD(P)H-dependent FMN reductase
MVFLHLRQLEMDMLAKVKEFKSKIKEADAILIATRV